MERTTAAARRLGRQIGRRARMAERVRRLQVDEARDREERGVEPLSGGPHRERRLGLDHRIPSPDRVEARQDHVRLRAHQRCQRGIELPAATLADERPHRLDAPDPVRDLDELRQVRQPRRGRHLLAPQLARPPPPVPLLIRGGESVEHVVGQPELVGEGPRHRRVVVDHVVHLAPAGDGEFEPDPETMERGRPEPSSRMPAAAARRLPGS